MRRLLACGLGLAATTLLSTLTLAGDVYSTTAAPAAVTHTNHAPRAGYQLMAQVDTAKGSIRWYTIKSGDTLSGIAVRFCGHANDWTGIFTQNRKTIGGDPNRIFPAQRIAIITCSDPAALLRAYSAPRRTVAGGGRVWGVTYGYPNKCGDGDLDGWDVSCSTPAVTYQAPAAAAPATYNGSGGMQQCIIARESGGNSQVMNASGHYGLYQFSASTWAAHGGNPADFGHASVAEQNQVYYATVAQDGYSDWSPYDGC